MIFKKQEINGWLVLTVEGEMSFNFIDNLDELSSEVKKYLKTGCYRFIFDFTKVPFIDSSGISVVIIAMSSAMKNKTPVKICGLNEETKKSFELIKINFGVEYYDTLQAALS